MSDKSRKLPSHAQTSELIASLKPTRRVLKRSTRAVDEWEESLESVVDGNHAAVVPSSLMAFSAQISRQDKLDILLCHQMVQMLMRAARAQKVTDDWFAYYKRRLEYFGWYELYLPDSGPSSSYLPPDDISPQTLQAIDDIGAPGTGLQFPALERLERDLAARQVMERGTVVGNTGVYRFLPSVTSANGMVEALLYQRETHNVQQLSTGLFFSEIESTTQVKERLAVIAYRPDHFERHRQEVIDALRLQAENAIYAL